MNNWQDFFLILSHQESENSRSSNLILCLLISAIVKKLCRSRSEASELYIFNWYEIFCLWAWFKVELHLRGQNVIVCESGLPGWVKKVEKHFHLLFRSCWRPSRNWPNQKSEEKITHSYYADEASVCHRRSRGTNKTNCCTRRCAKSWWKNNAWE